MARIWKENDEINDKLTVDEFYGNGLKDFMGHHFTVATNPWSQHVQAVSLSEEIGNFEITPYTS